MSLSLLIVEDDREAAGMLADMISLKLPGIVVQMAHDGVSGLRCCREGQADIVVTDINMPELDGLSMIEEINALRPGTKFIVLSGYSNRKSDCGSIPIHEYFVKPVDMRALLRAIEACIAELQQAC